MNQCMTNLQWHFCDLRRFRSACISAQSDQSLRWSHVPSTVTGLSKDVYTTTLLYGYRRILVDVQADLSLCCSPRSYCRSCRTLAHTILFLQSFYFLPWEGCFLWLWPFLSIHIIIQSTLVISTSLISNDRLSRMNFWSLFQHGNLTTGTKILWKSGEIAP